MKYLIFLFAAFLFFASCELEEEVFTTSSLAKLTFSRDTLSFDTIFTQRGSITRRLRVYNRNKNAIQIDRIRLNSNNSFYTLIVNGKEKDEFNDLKILGMDSMLILVKVFIDPSDEDTPFIVSDNITFLSNNNQNAIPLIAYGQNAEYFRNQIIECNTTFSAMRPYVISDTVLVDSLCTLTIEKGANIYFDSQAILFVKGSLIVEGDSMKGVSFLNSRKDRQNDPGQWKGIYFLTGSTGNKLEYATIRNAEIGLRIGTPDENSIPDVEVYNSRIENMSMAGVMAFTSDLVMVNTLIDNCGEYTVANFAGGNYIYQHCTFANFSFDFFRDKASVVFSDNLVLADNSLLTSELNVILENSIVWGGLEEEVLLSSSNASSFNILTRNNILKTQVDELDINNNILNMDPSFKNPRAYEYQLDTLSPAKDKGLDLGVEFDITGKARDEMPDLGAYERIE